MQLTTLTHVNNQRRRYSAKLLTSREIEILSRVATGQTNQEIADTLWIELGTVKWHLSNIYAKLSARNRTQAVAHARELNILGVKLTERKEK